MPKSIHRENADIRVLLETNRYQIRCRCSNGHVFSGEIFKNINAQTHAQAIRDLAVHGGMHRVICPRCKITCHTAEPFTLHNPSTKQLALFVPGVLTHRELSFKVELLNHLSKVEAGVYPFYFEQFQTLSNPEDLIRWLDGKTDSLSAATDHAWPESDGSKSDEAAPEEPTPLDLMNEKPPIHEAFADLERYDSDVPSFPPEPEEMVSLDSWAPEKSNDSNSPHRDTDDRQYLESLYNKVNTPIPPSNSSSENPSAAPIPPGEMEDEERPSFVDLMTVDDPDEPELEQNRLTGTPRKP